ncbi:hypothetical protein T03_9232 [Trichinella britovi]|uniref:Uncharacterized protein n=1 Tax=Trichinella britovi TaxID=45882 RepID=A0A0V1AK61_TRIBR|nr:hypothetical protein T03_9232 [Trichinella britovi]
MSVYLYLIKRVVNHAVELRQCNDKRAIILIRVQCKRKRGEQFCRLHSGHLRRSVHNGGKFAQCTKLSFCDSDS